MSHSDRSRKLIRICSFRFLLQSNPRNRGAMCQHQTWRCTKDVTCGCAKQNRLRCKHFTSARMECHSVWFWIRSCVWRSQGLSRAVCGAVCGAVRCVPRTCFPVSSQRVMKWLKFFHGSYASKQLDIFQHSLAPHQNASCPERMLHRPFGGAAPGQTHPAILPKATEITVKPETEQVCKIHVKLCAQKKIVPIITVLRTWNQNRTHENESWANLDNKSIPRVQKQHILAPPRRITWHDQF